MEKIINDFLNIYQLFKNNSGSGSGNGYGSGSGYGSGNGDGDGSVSYGERLAKEAKARNQVGNNIPFHRGQ